MVWPLMWLCLLCHTTLNAKEGRTPKTDSLLKALSAAKADTEKAGVFIHLSDIYRVNDVPKEFYYADEALMLSEKAGWDNGKMYAEERIGECYKSVMAYNEAIAYFNQCISEARKLRQKDIERTCLQEVAYAYHELGNYAQAAVFQKAAVTLAAEMNDPYNECRQMNYYGLRLKDLGNNTEAIAYWRKAIAFADAHFKDNKRMDMTADILNNMAGAYVNIRKTDSALYSLDVATGLVKQTKNDLLSTYLISTYCDIYKDLKKHKEAIKYGEQTLQMNKIVKDIYLQQHYTQLLSREYELANYPEQALENYKKYDSITAIIVNTQKTVNGALDVARIRIEQQIEQTKLEQRSYEAIRRNQNAALIAVAVALAALLTLTIFIYRSLRQKQKDNKTISLQASSLQEQNKIIDKSLKEKEVLLKETHHRVKNNLQLISSLLELQTRAIEDEGAKNALRAAQRRVQSIATVHSRLYGSDDDEDIELSAFTADLFTRLNSAFSSDGGVVEFDNAIPATLLPLSTVVVLGLILNELITNSFKHAFSGTQKAAIQISLVRDNANCRLQYYDNGPGLPGNVSFANTESLGLYLIRRLSKQLKGTAAYSYDAGSIFTIIFPYAGN